MDNAGIISGSCTGETVAWPSPFILSGALSELDVALIPFGIYRSVFYGLVHDAGRLVDM
jgi:hypothetical protein